MNNNKILCYILVFMIMISNINIVFAIDPDINKNNSDILENAINFLHDIQNEDGGFPSRDGRDSSTSLTCWVTMALVAADEDIYDDKWSPSGRNPFDYINNNEEQMEQTTDYARMLLTLSAAGKGSNYQGIDLAERIISFQNENGQFAQIDNGEDEMINAHMWSILALASAGYEIPNKEKAKKWLISKQNNDGGFGWVIGIESDTDDTAIAIQTLTVLGENPKTSSVIIDALSFIKVHQQDNGGVSSNDMMGSDSNAASDAWTIQGLIAASEDPMGEDWSIGNENLITHLESLQDKDGFINWQTGISSSKVTMTAYAIMALASKPIPINIDYSKIEYDNETFSDIDNNYWAYDSILDLVRDDILHGYPDGRFKPDKLVKRAEFTNLIISGLGFQNSNYNMKSQFTDIDQSHWAYKYILIAYDKGFIKGKSSHKFDPSGNIKGSELATMMINSLPIDMKKNLTEGEFWYSGNVKLADEYDLLYPDFKPEEFATRAECAYSITKLRDIR